MVEYIRIHFSFNIKLNMCKKNEQNIAGSSTTAMERMNATDELPTLIKYIILYSISEMCLVKKIR
jgi:hypothetical protein